MELNQEMNPTTDYTEILKSVSKSSPSCIYEFLQFPDNTSKFSYISDACEKIYRAKAKDIYLDVGLVFKTIHPDDIGWITEEIIECAKTLAPWKRDYRLRYEDGSIAWIEAYAIARKREDGVVVFHGTQNDITERKAFESRLISSAKLATLGELSAGVAHEINNPLMVIVGSAEKILANIKKGDLNAEVISKSLNKILEMSARIEGITKSLRTVSRDDSQEQFSKVDFLSVFNDSTELVKEHFKSAGVNLEANEIISTELECRPTQVSQVLINLLNNACDAAQTTDEKWVKVSAKVTPQKDLRITVQDSGRGIKPDVVAKMMTPFFTTKGQGLGTGLGLSIVQKIVTLHKGTIRLDESQPNTTFVVELPLRQ